MKIRKYRALRALRSAVFGLTLFSGLLVGGTGTAFSFETAVLSPVDSGTVSRLKLHMTQDYDLAIAGAAANPDLHQKRLQDLAGTGSAAQTGLCNPTPFNPGVDADGYCWGNAADDSGSNDWYPQGFSVPHTVSGDGTWNSRRWEVTSWHYRNDNVLSKLRFIDRGSSTPRYIDVLLVTAQSDGSVAPVTGNHVDGVVWYENHLLIANGSQLVAVSLENLMAPTSELDGFSYVLPIEYTYSTGGCNDLKGSAGYTPYQPCLNGISFDRSNGALTTSEYRSTDNEESQRTGAIDGPPTRIIRWPFAANTGLPKADDGTTHGDSTAAAAWYSPVWSMQGVVYAQGSFFISGACPSSFDNSYREPACIHKGAPGGGTSVLTQAPDMTQNLDWDASTGRIRGVNEVGQSSQPYPQRVVFDISGTSRSLSVVRFKNVNSGKCLTPYGASLNNGADIVQWDCNGHSGENWYWNGSEIRSFLSNRCLTIYGGSTSNGALAVQWDCNGSPSQQWTRVAGNGGSMLRNGNTLCLTVYGGSTDNGADANQWSCDSKNLAHAWVGYTP
ncbi:RICIN domain-containing protein [Streptomyces sp. NPDC056683]|uniref:RICIN domain-containing protein n=1 Tax=Streptomyces sp. NPDC056683 TaxID=3345910 RepID=UPI0036CBB2B4